MCSGKFKFEIKFLSKNISKINYLTNIFLYRENVLSTQYPWKLGNRFFFEKTTTIKVRDKDYEHEWSI